MDAQGLSREAESGEVCRGVRPSFGVKSSRESGLRLQTAGPEWGHLGNAAQGAGREQASEAVVGCGLGSPSPASRGSAARSGPRASGSQRQRKSLKTFFPLLPTSSSLLPLLLPLLPAAAAAAFAPGFVPPPSSRRGSTRQLGPRPGAGGTPPPGHPPARSRLRGQPQPEEEEEAAEEQPEAPGSEASRRRPRRRRRRPRRQIKMTFGCCLQHWV